MATYISILRGINVGGQRSVKMDQLKKMYEDLNFSDIRTYIQSGNVIFRSGNTEKMDLEMRISEQIKNLFGIDVPVIVIDAEELKEIIESNPYGSDPGRDISHLHVTFLSSRPEKDKLEDIFKNSSKGEEVCIAEMAVYLYCPNGYGKTKLTNAFFESRLKCVATTRNWRTTLELLNIAEKPYL